MSKEAVSNGETASLHNGPDTCVDYICPIIIRARNVKMRCLPGQGKVVFLQTFFRYSSLLKVNSNRQHFDGKSRKNPKNIR